MDIAHVFVAGLVWNASPYVDPTARLRRLPPTWWNSQHNRDRLEFGARVAHALWAENDSAARYSTILRRAA